MCYGGEKYLWEYKRGPYEEWSIHGVSAVEWMEVLIENSV